MLIPAAHRVLVTNDDGPAALGLRALAGASAASPGHEVVVAAPAVDMSSMGTALYLAGGAPAEAWPSDRPWPGAAVGYEVAAYPAGIVTMAMMGAFGPPPDVVLAGVNHGLNMGRGLVHSATVGAAMTAAVHGVPAVAFSAAADADWAAWSGALAWLLGALGGCLRDWPSGTVLNVNLPTVPPLDRPEPVWCQPAGTVATATLARRSADGGRQLLAVTYGPERVNRDDTDAGVLASGRIALTSLALPYADPVAPAWKEDVSRRLRAAAIALIQDQTA